MEHQFKVEQIFERKPVGVLARQLDELTFELGDEPRLGGCPIKHFVTQPRALKKDDGTPDLKVFCFYLENGKDKDHFVVGEVVCLES